jgi:S-DNA-T family DNA segregation ATPase FtsK/SpoIIIE
MGRQKIEEEMADGELKISKTASGFVKEPVNGLNKAVKQDKLEPIINRPPEPRRAEFTVTAIRQGSDSSWQFPSVDLLEDSKNRVDSGDIEANAKIIKQTLQEFGIEVEMGMVNVGPTVAQYTFRPVTGIKLSQIGALQNDLALALAASPIRMELPIPGKSLVGIEVPNKTKGIVRIKELLVTHEYQNHASKLAFSLGQDVSGNPLVLDLAKMPHLLIAGATGTGKSVCVNSILISLLYRATPSDVRLIVIDPKRVELSMYNGIPHLLTPVITDHEKAVNALRWAVAEMDRRYKLLSEVHKRNILEYNAAQLEDKMSYIVVMVDELADLMAVAQKDVEATIIRLSQMARAVGIHIVVATQSPRVNVITGLIKANITSRIAFNVASQVDSRTILDLSGAEKLLGSGDMLYVTPELSKPKRAQGTYVIEKEIKRVVEFLKDQSGSVIYNDEVVEKPKRPVNIPGFEGSSEGEEDEVLDQAIELVNSTGKASATFLQRRLSIGYARAARILDVLEQRGVVGPGNGAKPREVFGYTGGTNGIDDSEAEEFERQQVASSAGRDDEEDL